MLLSRLWFARSCFGLLAVLILVLLLLLQAFYLRAVLGIRNLIMGVLQTSALRSPKGLLKCLSKSMSWCP